MSIIKNLCEKYREKIKKGELVDLDELTAEIQEIDLEMMCAELAEYLEAENARN